MRLGGPPSIQDAGQDLLDREARRLSAVRMQMLELHPFWGYLLLQVKLVAALGLEAFAATDCVRTIWYNPLRTRYLSMPQLGFVLAHEVGHQLFASTERRRGRNAWLWNCATDFAINRIVSQIEHPGRHRERLYEPPQGTFPELGEVKILLDRRWDGMIAEAIYEYLAAETLPEPVSVTVVLGASQGGRGVGGGGGGVEGDDPCGGRRLRVPNVTDHRGGVDIHLPGALSPVGLSPGDRDELTRRIEAAVETALRAGEAAGAGAYGSGYESQEVVRRGVGNIPGEALRRVGLSGRSRVPWRRVFRGYVGQAVARDDYSLRHPNRRYLEQGLVVPGLYSERLGRVVVAVDTSASMSREALGAIATELEHLAGLVEEVTLLVADTEVRQVVTGERVVPFLRAGHLKGGGGTDHRPVFAWVAQRRLRPDVFIGLTDLESRFPARRPPYPVLWVVPDHRDNGDDLLGTGGYGGAPAQRTRAPWGRVVTLQAR